MKVAICTPHGGKGVSPDFYRTVLEMQGHEKSQGMEFFHVDVDMMIVGKARNMCVETALENEADVLFFIDDDVLVPPNAALLVDLASTLGVVSGLYFSRRLPYTPQLYMLAEEEELKGLYWPMVDYPDKQMFIVDAVGAGCLAVRADIFHKLTTYAESTRKTQDVGSNWRDKVAGTLSPWFEFLDSKGEDLYFCERLRDINQNVWVEPTIKCGHVGEIVITEDHFKYLRDNGMLKKEVRK